MGWFESVREGIYEALCASFGCDPDADGLKRFIPAYDENVNVPEAPRNVDVAYYNVETYQGNDDNLDYVENMQILVEGQTKTQIKKSVPASVLVTFYGPNADDDAEKFWSAFQFDFGKGSPRSILRGKNIVPIGKPLRPVSVFEVEGTYKRRRSDVRVNLAYLDVEAVSSSEVHSAPDIQVQINN